MCLPVIFGIPFHLLTGIILFILIIFQIASARKLFHIPFKWHRIVGYIMLVMAIIHGVLGIILYSGLFI